MLDLRAWRLARNFTKKDMADVCNIHENTYSNWENHPHTIPIGQFHKLADKLEVDPSMIKIF